MEGNDTHDQPLSATASTVQAWLASMPLGEELERLRAELAAAKARLAATAAEIPPLKSAIESANSAVAARREEVRRKQAAEAELRRRVDRGRAELRRLRDEIAAARGAKDALERRAVVRRQAAHALELAERAVAAEARALAWAAEQAARAVGDGDGDAAHHDDDFVTLPARRVEELRGAVEAEEREAAARIEESEARRRAAKAQRAAAVARLDAARAGRREAGDELLQRVDGGDDGHGKRGRSGPTRRRPSGRSSCFAVKKLRRFFFFSSVATA